MINIVEDEIDDDLTIYSFWIKEDMVVQIHYNSATGLTMVFDCKNKVP